MFYRKLYVLQETLAVGLFRQCAAVSVACHWAWAGLGRTKMHEGKLAEAASHIQQVSQPDNSRHGTHSKSIVIYWYYIALYIDNVLMVYSTACRPVIAAVARQACSRASACRRSRSNPHDLSVSYVIFPVFHFSYMSTITKVDKRIVF